jgi:basic amino acid/polyamine antiporter, APA family
MSKSHQLGFFSVSMITLSLIIGLGIFKMPAGMAANAGTEKIFFTAWIIGGLTALCGALTYAEIGKRLPSMGGYYQVFNHCYHPVVGFTVNILILLVNAANLGIVALIGADYLSDMLFGGPSGRFFNIVVAVFAVAVFYAVNLLGLKTSSQAQNAMTVIKGALIVLLISSLFSGVRVVPHGYEDGIIRSFDGKNGLLLLLLSLISVSFTYGGYQQALNFGAEVKPGPTLQRGIIVGTLMAILLYLGINFAYVQVIGFEQMRNATAIGALLFEAWFGPMGAKVFDAAMFLSVMAYVNIILLSNPRVMYAMSQDKALPAAFSKRNPKTGVLTHSLTAYAALTILIVLIGKDIDKILGFSMFLDSVGMCTSAATLFILRKRSGDPNASWITPWLAAFFVLSYSMVAVAVTIQSPIAAVIGVALMVVLAGVYFFFVHRKED